MKTLLNDGNKMKKILHLFRTEKFTEGFIDLMKNIPEHEHMFWVYGERYLNDQCSYLKVDNVKYFPKLEIKLNKKTTEKEFENYDLIVYHGVFENYIIEYFYTHKDLLDKLILYFWGGDKEKLPENTYERKAKKFVVRNSLAVVTIILQDYFDLGKKYRLKGKHFCAKYYNEYEVELINKMINVPHLHRETINIQLGNSATVTNNHLDILNTLSKFKENDIQIYVPLSYGAAEYTQQVITYGKEIFGDKFIPFTKFMPVGEYYNFLNKMDIAIFDMKRQQALGNIHALMRMGCKIYFNKNSILWDFFVNGLGCIVADVNEISEIGIEEFATFSEKDREYNRIRIYEAFSKEKSVVEWKKIFDSL
jgi:4-alpha-L-fucosyltransferase (Fuc4NAc transferase).